MAVEPDKVERVLPEAENLYRLLAENVSDVLFTLDLGLRPTYCSPSVERLTGYTVEEVISRGLRQVLSPASYQLAKATLREGLARDRTGGGAPSEPRTMEVEFSRKGGGSSWAEARVSLLHDQSGELVGILGVARVIDERKKVEKSLRESEEKHRLLFQKAMDPILLLDGDTYVDCNEAALRSMGCSRDHLIGLHPWDISPEQQPDGRVSREKMHAMIETALSEGVNRFEWLHRAFNGQDLWADVSLIVVTIGGKQTIYALWRDVEKRKRAEEALLTSQLHLSEAVDLAKIVYWELDWVTETFIFNDAFYTFYGTTAEREGGYRMAAGEYAKRFVHPDDLAMVQESAQRNRSEKDPEFLVDLEHRIIRRDGEVRCVLARTRGFRNAEGRIIRCYGANQDITARKRAEEERAVLESRLRQTQKMEAIGRISAGIAHDFKNILTAIGGFANLAAKHVQPDSKAKRYLDRISRAVERGRDLVGQILTFSHKDEDEPGPTELIPVVRESVRMLRASLHPAIEIREEFRTGSSLVHVDPTQVQQVIVNLANNAAFAMGKRGGTLTIELSDVNLDSQNAPVPGMTAGQYLKLSISDTGVGMDAQTIERVFDPFFTTKKRAEGTGLGLWVVHSIVKKHRGAITVRSAPGKGSTFDVFLPRIVN